MNAYTADEVVSMTSEKLEATYWEAIEAVLAAQDALTDAIRFKDLVARERDGRLKRAAR